MIIVLSSYVIVGALFALWFVSKGFRKLDPGATGARWTVRMLWLPAALLLWPLLLSKTLVAR